MNPMMKQIVNQKMQNLTPSSLIQLGKQYGFNLTQNQAQKIVHIIRNSDVDIFDSTQRTYLLKKISQQVSPELANHIQRVINQFV